MHFHARDAGDHLSLILALRIASPDVNPVLPTARIYLDTSERLMMTL